MDRYTVYQTRFPLKCLLTCHQRWFRLALMTNGQRPCAVHARTSCSNPSKPTQLATGLVLMLKHGYLVDHMITTWEPIYISRMLGAMGNSSSMWPVHETLCATASNLSTKFESSMRTPSQSRIYGDHCHVKQQASTNPPPAASPHGFVQRDVGLIPCDAPSASPKPSGEASGVSKGVSIWAFASYVLRTFAASKHGNEWKFPHVPKEYT